MIIVFYDRKRFTLAIGGHARSAPKGDDLVCAAASALICTAAAAVEKNAAKFRPKTTLESGHARISCDPEKEARNRCRTVLDTVFTGFQALESKYPACVITKRAEEHEQKKEHKHAR